MLALGGFTLSGSSPLARGSPHGPPHRQPGRGIIPARAGFTLVSACRSGVSGDHPRSRGVHGGGWGDGVAGLGSSPLARGSLLHREVGRSVDRIIPARAGFTSPTPAAAPSPSDHPRSRGVHDVVRVNPWTIIRIIPARAGFTPGRSLPPRPLRDHPRSRGVHQGVPTQLLAIIGSSPLARGSRHWGQRLQGDEGIIPARAGFTQGPSPCSWLPPDHPRSRGVHFGLEEDSALVDGSSPLARGSQVGFSGDALGVRIIPARAGFTARPSGQSRLQGDHPRSRGVHTRGSLESQRRVTLSDLVCIHCRPSARSTEFR